MAVVLVFPTSHPSELLWWTPRYLYIIKSVNDHELSEFDRSAHQPGDGESLGVGCESPNTWLKRASIEFGLSCDLSHSATIRAVLIDSAKGLCCHARE
jgi:hypothetical protein